MNWRKWLLRLAIPAILGAFALPAKADQRIYGSCQTGATTVNSQGILSTNQVQGSFPSCTVTVFNTGTLVLATIYADNARTPKANPFTAASDGSWFYYEPSGARADIVMSGGGFISPVTLGDVLAVDATVGSVVAQSAISFTATPVFNAAAFGAFSMTLTGNVTSSTITGSVPGQQVVFSLCQDAVGGRTFVWPVSFLAPPVIDPTALACSQFSFVLLADAKWHQLAASPNVQLDTNNHFTGTQTFDVANIANLTVTGSFTGPVGSITPSVGTFTNLTANNIAALGGMTSPLFTLNNTGVFTNTQQNDYLVSNLNGLTIGANFANLNPGNHATEAIVGAVNRPAGATALIASGVAGYHVNNTPGPNSFSQSFYGNGIGNATGATVYTLNGNLTCNTGLPCTMQGVEVDGNVNNATDNMIGFSVAGAWGVQPGNFTTQAIQIGKPSGIAGRGAFWPTGILFQPGATDSGASGPTNQRQAILFYPSGDGNVITGVAESSQGPYFVSRDGAGHNWNGNMYMNASGNFIVRTSSVVNNGVPDLPYVFGSSGVFSSNAAIQPSTSSDIVRQIETVSGAGCTTGAAALSVCTTVLTWPTTFADNTYKVTCSGVGVVVGNPIIQVIATAPAGSVTVSTQNLNAVAASFPTIECIGVKGQ